jgi:hypothetical protein
MNILRIFRYTFLLLTVLVGNALAQTEEQSTTTEVLKSKVQKGDYLAIEKAGESNDLTLIPYLKQLASNVNARSNFNTSAFQAHIALAKLGNKEAMQEILAEVDADNPDVQDNAMKKLASVANNEAFQKFYQLLDDSSERENPQCKINIENFKKNHPEGENCNLCCDVIFFPRNTMAMFFLTKMVGNPPAIKGLARTEKAIAIWKEWFAKNKPWIQ